VLADDHPMYRYGLRAVLASCTDIVVAGEATTGRELMHLVETTRPDVVITDLCTCQTSTGSRRPASCWPAVPTCPSSC
jgi:DNA-binding NarL/FixJ family response regulator